MATSDVKESKIDEVQEIIPSHDELVLEELVKKDFVLVQWIGAKTISKLAPSPTGAVRAFGAENYGLVNPKEFLMVQKEDANDKRFYRKPTAKEKPSKAIVRLSVSGRKGTTIRVTWKGMPTDTLDKYNRR